VVVVVDIVVVVMRYQVPVTADVSVYQAFVSALP
jgi:hypothetical protein